MFVPLGFTIARVLLIGVPCCTAHAAAAQTEAMCFLSGACIIGYIQVYSSIYDEAENMIIYMMRQKTNPHI
jgi:hypothetical protein